MAKALSDLTKKDIEFEWGPEQQESFEVSKTRLCEAPILAFPDFDKSFILTREASDYAVGAALSQLGEDGEELPVAYLSRLLNKEERNYTTTEKECLAVLYPMNQFRPYLLCKEFTLVSDHKSLNYMHSRTDPGQRLRGPDGV